MALAQCLNRADERYWQTYSTDSDLIAAFDETRLRLAETADAGTITPADFDHQLASRQNLFKDEMARRDNDRLHQSWSISHGLDEATRPDPPPVPVIPPE